VTTAAALANLAESSPSLRPTLQSVARAASTDAPILILGEAGSGRSTLARTLHQASARAHGPLVEVDIGLIPSTLFESEFFGHRVGAFTGAEASVEGKVLQADGGTLLLDHVEEIPVASQPKLLRLLSEQRFTPLGGTDTRSNVRFLGIGSEDLPQRVTRGTFRKDLFYRLEVVTVRLPPLRHRKEDLDPLLESFLADLQVRFGVGRLEVSATARAWMEGYSWPGNLRELKNVLERAVILQGGGALDPPGPSEGQGGPESLVEVEKRQIILALAHTRGHQGRAAELLGISRKTLWEKRRRYGIP
jgi:DNA-binding NtrC family response regulator